MPYHDAQVQDHLRGTEIVIKALVDHYIHTDRLIWQRIPMLMFLDAAVWSGMYVTAQDNGLISVLVGLAGIVFTYMLLVIVLGAVENRNLNMPLVDRLLGDYVGPATLERLAAHAKQWKAPQGWLLLFAVPEQKDIYFRNRALRFRAVRLFEIAFWGSIVVDAIAVVYVIACGIAS